MAGQWEPQVGDLAVDLHRTGKVYDADRIGQTVTVKRVTETLVITSDGERYNRRHLVPVGHDRYAARKLVPANDDRVLCVRGRTHVAELARVVDNLARIDRKDPADHLAALAQIGAAAREAYAAFARELAEASRTEQASER